MSGATTATYLAVAAVAVSAAGAVASGISAKQQADSQSKVLRQQADRERLQSEADEKEFRDQQQRLMAKRRAVLGGSGVDLSSGSPLLASEDFAGETELQALKIRNGGDVRATRLEQSAAITGVKGDAALAGGFFRAGSSLLQNEKVQGLFE
jgi:hypothetical protein